MKNNRINKPKLTSIELVQKMRDEKGITFKYFSEEEAAEYLSNVNNYMRTASYRKNYTQYQNGKNAGKYERLDFAYLKELSTIDMYYRGILSKLCLDIEHALKVRIVKDIVCDEEINEYDIVYRFLKNNSFIVESIARKHSATYTNGLIENYFEVSKENKHEGKNSHNIILAYDDCPAWVLVELLSFGDFLKFYEFYYDSPPIRVGLLNIVKSLRNGAAHNCCMLSNLNQGTSKPAREIKEFVKNIEGITKSQRQACLRSRPLFEFVTMLHVYVSVVSPKVKYYHLLELKQFIYGRMKEKKNFFISNALITSRYDFVKKVLDSLI